VFNANIHVPQRRTEPEHPVCSEVLFDPNTSCSIIS